MATAPCDTCGKEVTLDPQGKAMPHKTTWTPFAGVPDVPQQTVEIRCEGSGLIPIHVPAGEVNYLSNHFESNRRKH